MDNLPENGNNENQDELIDKLIQEKTNEINEMDQTDTKIPAETPSSPSEMQQGVEDIQKLVQEADKEANLPPKTTKKFVIAVQQDYIEYFESMTPDKRAKLINDFLRSEIVNKNAKERVKFVKKILKHLLIILLTVIIGVPIIFIIVNSSINSTLQSYKYMQVNFEKLYQQKNLNKLN